MRQIWRTQTIHYPWDEISVSVGRVLDRDMTKNGFMQSKKEDIN